jgi:hypothetical protein
MKEYNLGGTIFYIPEHPKMNPGRNEKQQADYEHGMRENEKWEQWCHDQANMELKREEEKY